MKKIFCELNYPDFIRVSSVFTDDNPGVFLDSEERGKMVQIYLSPEKIRKLRKQLKKALIAIEGVERKESSTEDDWFSPGKKVVIVANNSNHDFPIGTVAILRKNELNCENTTHCEYLDGHDYWFVRMTDCKPYKEDEA